MGRSQDRVGRSQDRVGRSHLSGGGEHVSEQALVVHARVSELQATSATSVLEIRIIIRSEMQKATITRAASSVANRTARASNQATLASQTQPSAFAESDFTRVRSK